MENDMQQKIEQRLAELPEDVQAAIASSDFDEKVRTIGQAQGLHIDQMEALSDEVMLAMLGFVGMDDLAKGVEQQVRLDPAKAQAITDAVNKEIFLPIRESMKAWAAGKKGGGTPPATPSDPAQSVVMPSSAPKPAMPPAAASSATVAAPAPAPQPAQAPNLAAADAILSEKKVVAPITTPTPPAAVAAPATPAASPMPKVDPAQPQTYKADPYREPVE